MSFSTHEKQFLSSAATSVIVPNETQTSLSEILNNNQEGVSLQSIAQRDLLFFDESIIAYIVLHVPQCSEEDLKSYLSRLELKIEGWITSEKQHVEGHQSSTLLPRDLLLSETVKKNEDPIVLISQTEDDESIFLDLIWEVPLRLNRPRSRIQSGKVTFAPVALVKPVGDQAADITYLESFQPQVANLFEPLRGSRGYEKDTPYLPVSQLDAVLPQQPKDDHTYHIRSTPSQPISTHLAFVTRLRYSKPNIHDAMPATIALFDVEMIPFVSVKGRIVAADMNLQKGKVVHLTGEMLPMTCQSKDCVTLLYRLEQIVDFDRDSQASRQIDVLKVTVKVELNLSHNCNPVIQMNWTTNIDFTQLLSSTPSLSGPSTQRNGMPPNLSIDGVIRNSYQMINMSLQPASEDIGPKMVTISFAACDKPVRVGVPFTWQILIVNRNDKPAKLAIIPLPRIQKPTSQAQQYAKRHATRSSVTSIAASERNGLEREQNDIAPAAMDENIVYAMQHSSAIPPETDLMSLTPELRVGPLGSGQCHEGEIRLVAFKSGAFTLDAIRIVDLVKEAEQGYGGPGVVMDIRELPDVIVEADTLGE